MKRFQRAVGTALALVALVVTGLVYQTTAARSSDHQDTPTMIARPGADITDVFVYPSPANPANVVLQMDVNPLIPPGTTAYFDPAVLYQFKMVHGPNGTTAAEDTVIQFTVSGNGLTASQSLTMYGPTAPVTTGTTNSLAGSPTGTVAYGKTATLANGIQIFAGERADPFFFDLFAFFNTLPDRNAQYHPPLSNPSPVPSPASTQFGPPNATGVAPNTLQAFSFRGFNAANSTSATLPIPAGMSCALTPGNQQASADALSGNRFNVLTIIVEVPKTLLQTGSQSSLVHLWATTSTATGS